MAIAGLSRPLALFLAVDLAALAVLTLGVTQFRGVGSWDHAANALFAPYRDGALLGAFLWITDLGAGAGRIAVVASATALLWAFRHPGLILPYWVVFLGTEATTWGLKYFVGRARPDFVTEAIALSPSFPSAHAAGSVAVYGFLAYLTAREVAGWRERVTVGAVAGALVAVIGFSRIFLSVHFVTDVMGGFLIAAFWLAIGATLAASAERGRFS